MQDDNKLAMLMIGICVIGLLVLMFVKATDGICKKKFSNEFKQTQQYKDMQCPEGK